jgi:phenylacetate-CoA ligase
MPLEWLGRMTLCECRNSPARGVRNFFRNKDAKLRDMIRYIYKTPFYRRIMDEQGLTPSDIITVDDLKKLPILSKQDILDAKGLINRQLVSKRASTSGSSGTMLNVAYDKRSLDMYDAVWTKALFETGYKPWNRLAMFTWKPVKKKLNEQLGIMPKNVLLMRSDYDRQIEKLRKLNPSYIYCYSSHFNILFQKLNIRPRSIILTGENSSKNFKQSVSESLGCMVFEQYATTEFEVVAWQCKNGNMHISEETVHVEIVDGEIVITGLVNKAMPLIRYKIGDRGSISKKKCDCGCKNMILDRLDGRSDDFIKLPSGKLISPTALSSYIEIGDEFYMRVMQYQIIQKGVNDIEIIIVPKDTSGYEEVVKNRLAEYIKEPVNIEVNIVKHIPVRRGKMKVVRSEI